MENFFILAFIIIIFLFLLIGFYIFRLKKRMDIFFQKGDRDLEKFLSSQMKRLEKQETDMKKISQEISNLKRISRISFQKIGLVRYILQSRKWRKILVLAVYEVKIVKKATF